MTSHRAKSNQAAACVGITICTRSRLGSSRWLCWGLLCVATLAAPQRAAASPGPAGAPAAAATPRPAAALDALLRLGDDWPERAASGIAALQAELSAAATSNERRELALARAEIAARSQDDITLADARAAAQQAAHALGSALGAADERYLDTLRAERNGTAGVESLASDALSRYDALCAGAPAATAAAAVTASANSAGCELRTRWRLHHLLGQRAYNRQDDETAHDQVRAALELARSADNPWRQAVSELQLALLSTRSGNTTQGQQRLGQAQALAQRSADLGLQGWVLVAQAQMAFMSGDTTTRAEQPLRRALQLAQTARAARLQAAVHSTLADLALRQLRAQERPAAELAHQLATTALREAEAGLRIANRLGTQPMVRVMMHNAMLARLALGQTSVAQHELEQLQQAWAGEGNTGLQIAALRELADALDAAGNASGALALHHRERALTKQLMRANQASALAELRGRYGREAQQREIRLLASANAEKNAELMQQTLARRLWLLGAGAVALALLLTVLLTRRVRATNRQLEHSRARLRLQSECDALTGLANRRHLQAVLQAAQQRDDGTADSGLRGALLMLDIDHFKQINDGHGHAAGDAVLVAVARRIAAHVRDADTVARWGGEEFLILAPKLSTDEAQLLAQRLLQAIGGAPVTLPDGSALVVTASIGHGVFPLLPHAVPLRAEQAINLVDMALYRAKRQGRHRAVGIRSVAATDAAALATLEADFERGCAEGQVDLHEAVGPPLPAAGPAAGSAATPGTPAAGAPATAAH